MGSGPIIPYSYSDSVRIHVGTLFSFNDFFKSFSSHLIDQVSTQQSIYESASHPSVHSTEHKLASPCFQIRSTLVCRHCRSRKAGWSSSAYVAWYADHRLTAAPLPCHMNLMRNISEREHCPHQLPRKIPNPAYSGSAAAIPTAVHRSAHSEKCGVTGNHQIPGWCLGEGAKDYLKIRQWLPITEGS